MHPAESRKAEAAREFRQSWRVVGAAMLGMGLGFGGLPMYSFGVFIDPLVREFGWSLAEVGSWTFFANMGYVVTVVFTGHLTDRVGVRRVLLTAIPLFATALAAMALSGGRLWMLYAIGVFVGCVGTGTTAVTYARAVNSWFDAGRGTALGLTSAGIGLTSMLTPYLLQAVITNFGWRYGSLAMAALALVSFPVAYFWLAERRAQPSAEAKVAVVTGDTRAMAMRRPVFWLIAGGYLATCLANGGITTYLVSFLINAGLTNTQAAAYAGVLGVASMCGRLAGGVIIDRFHFALVCGGLLFAQALACAALGLHQVALAPLLIFVIGFALGVEVDCMTYSTARYYGMKAFSEICGIFGLMGGIGIAFGAVIFGRLAATSGGFSTALFACATLVAIGACLFTAAVRYPFIDARSEARTT